MADDFDALGYTVAAKLRGQLQLISPEAADVLRGFIAANGRDFGARYESCCAGPVQDFDRDDDTGALSESGDLGAPGTCAGWGILWPDSMGFLDYPEDLDDGPERPA